MREKSYWKRKKSRHPTLDTQAILYGWLYLYKVDNNTNINEYIQQAAALNQPDLKKEIMTIAETLRKEGMQQGMQQTLHEDILDILDLRFQSVSYSIKQQLSEIKDPVVLRKLLRLAVQAPTIEAFQNEIKP